MNADVKNLYFLIRENKVLVCESNLKLWFDLIPEEIRKEKGYDYFYNKMKKTNYFIIPFNKLYRVQKIEY
jgi:hypothetical protein